MTTDDDRAARGIEELGKLIEHFGLDVVLAYMRHVQDNAEESVRRVIDALDDGAYRYEMDSGAVIDVGLKRYSVTRPTDFILPEDGVGLRIGDTPLAKEQAIARSQLDTEIQAQLAAQAVVQAAKANVEQAQLNIEWTKVTSLISGIAGLAQVQIGNQVGPTSVLTTVSQLDPLKAYFTVSEQQFT